MASSLAQGGGGNDHTRVADGQAPLGDGPGRLPRSTSPDLRQGWDRQPGRRLDPKAHYPAPPLSEG
jgi:hypothetical protein